MGRRAIAVLVGAALVCGCVGRAQGFAGRAATWRAELVDRTGAVASIHLLEAAPPTADLPSHAVRLRNLGPTVVEVAWRGGPCLACARFSLAAGRGDKVDLRYDIGAPCDGPTSADYALEIRFDRPIDARSISAVTSWGP
jgi:hypothetical protein